MKTITLTQYTVRDIDAEPWVRTWDNLMRFGERMSPKIAPLDFKLRFRKMIMDDLTQDNLMAANMVTIECEEAGLQETPIENLLSLELDYTACPSCKTPGGQEFPCRTFKDFNGEECQTLPEEFFMEAVLRTVFASKHDHNCGGSCESCASGCGDEEIGIRTDGHGHVHKH
ncbi:MAG: DUF2703 domain-containing protein [Synergistes sp.]|nr:DUF2703 domain-containing protein [Synergistes sp.]